MRSRIIADLIVTLLMGSIETRADGGNVWLGWGGPNRDFTVQKG